MLQLFDVVTPEPRLGFEIQTMKGGRSALVIRLLNIDVGWQPQAGLQIRAPAIEMQIVRIPGMGRVRTIKTHDIKISVLDPDSAREQAFRRQLFWLNINHYTTYLAQELSAYKRERVVAFS